MAADGLTEQQAIIAYAKAHLCGGRVYPEVPDALSLPVSDLTGNVKPYVVIDFEAPAATQSDRSITGEEDQPQTMPVRIRCYAASYSTARRVGAACRTLLIGWQPSERAAQLRATYSAVGVKDFVGLPSRYVETIQLEAILT